VRLQEGDSLTDLSFEFQVSIGSLFRHKVQHLGLTLITPQQEKTQLRSRFTESLLKNLEKKELMSIGKKQAEKFQLAKATCRSKGMMKKKSNQLKESFTLLKKSINNTLGYLANLLLHRLKYY
jgi:hypothetical protein